MTVHYPSSSCSLESPDPHHPPGSRPSSKHMGNEESTRHQRCLPANVQKRPTTADDPKPTSPQCQSRLDSAIWYSWLVIIVIYLSMLGYWCLLCLDVPFFRVSEEQKGAAAVHSAEQHGSSVTELQSCKADTEIKARDLEQCHGLLGLRELKLNRLDEDMRDMEAKLRAKEQEAKLYYLLITSYHNPNGVS